MREYAMRDLGRYFSPDIEIRSQHQVVREGLYRHVRHPLLACMGLEIIGVGLVLNAYWTLAVVLGIGFYFPLLIIRKTMEEKALLQALGDDYQIYQSEVGAFFPKGLFQSRQKGVINMPHRVVITGLGVVAPNGIGKEAFWQALLEGLSGVRTIRRFDTSHYGTHIGGEIMNFNPLEYFDPHELKKIDRSNMYAIAAGQLALKDAQVDLSREDRERVGSSIGNALGGVDYVDKEIDVMRDKGPRWGSPYLAIAFFSCGTNGLLSIRFGLKGPVLTMCNGNTSGSDAIGAAYRTIRSGRADMMLAGATEAPLVSLFVGSLAKDGFLSKRNEDPERALRPFDPAADGMVLGEGAALLVLESLEHAQARGARIYAEVAGYASGSSAFDVLRPEPNGKGLVSTMKRALVEANLNSDDIPVIHCQGLSMPDHDLMEARCLWELFGKSPGGAGRHGGFVMDRK